MGKNFFGMGKIEEFIDCFVVGGLLIFFFGVFEKVDLFVFRDEVEGGGLWYVVDY